MVRIWLLVLMCSLCLLCFSEEYGGFHADPQNTGVFNDTVLKPPLKLKWRYFAEGTFKASPIIYRGRLFIVERQGQLYSLDAETGDLLWKRYYSGYASTNGSETVMPLAYGGKLYYLENGSSSTDRQGYFRCVRQSDGGLVWTCPRMGESVVSRGMYAPLAHKGRVYFISNVAVDKHTVCVTCFDTSGSGTPLWQTRFGPFSDAGGFGGGGLALYSDGNRELLVGGYGSRNKVNWRTLHGRIFALTPDSGRIIWERSDWSVTGSQMLIKDTLFYAYSNTAAMPRYICGNVFTGDTVWTAASWDEYKTSATDKYLFARKYGGDTDFWDRATGKYIGSCDWTQVGVPYVSATSGCGGISIANGYGYCGRGHGGVYESSGNASLPIPGGTMRTGRAQGIYAFEIPKDNTVKTLKIVWHYKLASNICPSGAIADGKLYYASNHEGVIYCFENDR